MPIINQPQVAILSTDAIKPQAGRGRRCPTAARPSPSTRSATWRMAGTTGPSTAPTPPASCAQVKEILETRDWAAELVTPMTLRGPLARAGCRYREALAPAARRCSSTARDDHLLLLEHPHVYTLGVRADLEPRAGRPGVGRRRAGARPTAAATSPTTGPASSSATRSCRVPASGPAAWPTPCLRARRRAAASSTRSPTSACPAPAGSTATRACGSTPTGPTRARSAPSACA